VSGRGSHQARGTGAVPSFRIGELRVDRIVDLEGPFMTAYEMFPDATEEALAPHLSWLVPRAISPNSKRLILPIQSYLVRTGRHTILIDTCIGCRKSHDFVPGWGGRTDEVWLANLRAAGARPEDIDYVMCTHLHVDHCGWNTRLVDGRWVPSFPNAKYLFARAEYEASAAANGIVFRESVLPVMEAGQAELVELDHQLSDGVWFEPTLGHTPGHVAVLLSSKGERGAMSGDLMHSPLQLAYPEWSPKIDWDRALAAKTRRAFLERHADTGDIVMTAHFPQPSSGRVLSEGDAFRFRYLGT
jgi:glyoxylase-like metal-dependent hydrolase (beta-lactamase superfamily II)